MSELMFEGMRNIHYRVLRDTFVSLDGYTSIYLALNKPLDEFKKWANAGLLVIEVDDKLNFLEVCFTEKGKEAFREIYNMMEKL